MYNPTQTVCAISTPPGKGGVALIRLSGTDAFAIADRVFRPRFGDAPLSARPHRMQIYGDVMLDGVAVDDGLATCFPSPHSYTGEDTVEVTCHGGLLVSRTVLEAFLAGGAILATAGEFTRRAFLNGRLSLTEAESIGDLLEAQSFSAMRLSGAQSRDRLRAEIDSIRASLVSLMSSIFARIDYPEEDLGELTDTESARELLKVRARIDKLLTTYRTGRAIQQGIRTVIVGKPNVGKSTLYNAILGEESAIVTDIRGTTRDVLSRTVPFGKVLLHLSDTAGIRESDDPVERIGVSRSREQIERAELILAVFDASAPQDYEDQEIIDLIKTQQKPKIALLNKSDLTTVIDKKCLSEAFDYTISLSAQNSEIDALRSLIEDLFTDGTLVIGEEPILTSARAHASLLRARDYVNCAIEAYASGFPADAASSDVELAIGALGEIDGKSVSEEIVADIFSRFCVGK